MSDTDKLDAFIDHAASVLGLPLEPGWKPAVRANLDVSLKLGEMVNAFSLPDDVEPAPVFKA